MQFPHDGRIGIIGKVVDGGDFGAQIVDETRAVAAGRHRRDRAGGAALRGATQFVQSLDAFDRVPDAPTDRVLDLLGGGAAIFHADLRLHRSKIGKGFALQRQRRHQTRGEDQHQQQVGRGRVFDEPADHSSSPAGVTIMPGIAGVRSSRMTSSPGLTPWSSTVRPACRQATETSRSSSRPSAPRR